jgi:hypothetical protein
VTHFKLQAFDHAANTNTSQLSTTAARILAAAFFHSGTTAAVHVFLRSGPLETQQSSSSASFITVSNHIPRRPSPSLQVR